MINDHDCILIYLDIIKNIFDVLNQIQAGFPNKILEYVFSLL